MHIPIGHAVLASSTDEHSSDGTEGSRPLEIDDLEQVLNEVSNPQ